MSKKPESTFKDRIRPLINALPKTFCEKIQQVTIRGTPDLLLCVNGRFVALELKSAKKAKTDPLQCYKLGRIQEAGGWALICYPDNWPKIYEFLKRLANGETVDESEILESA